MKNNKYFKFIFLSLTLSFLFGNLTSCQQEDITVGKADESKYIVSNETLGFIANNEGKIGTAIVELRKQANAELYINITKAALSDFDVNVRLDAAALENYNAVNNSSYKLLPQDLVNIADSKASFTKGTKRSSAVKISITSNNVLDENETYVIPVTVDKKDGIEFSGNSSTFFFFVKDFSKTADCSKASQIKIISCMEVNDTNPLNNLCFTLKNSGKPLVDMVILFSSNINYSEETGKVYVYHNPNVQHLLNNRAKYLKPLQDKGIKIILSILGNHDRSGVANLSKSAAKEFAQELKSVCDAYKLDGVFFDDEYSNYEYPAPAGFVSPSSDAAARLFYEAKKAMPDKILCAYAYGATSSFDPVDGAQPGTFVDYGIHDYGSSYDLSDNYPGLPKSGMGISSQEFNRGYFASDRALQSLRSGGYGAHMIFAMDPFRPNFGRQRMAMEKIAKYLFDDELVYTGKPYSKDW